MLLECGEPPPREVSVLPEEFVNPAPIPAAIASVAEAMLAQPSATTAISELLARRPTRTRKGGGEGGGGGEGRGKGGGEGGGKGRPDPGKVVRGITEQVLALERSYLCVQGPPGTGKTFAAAHAIVAAVEAGQTVGVLANSHKVMLYTYCDLTHYGRFVPH